MVVVLVMLNSSVRNCLNKVRQRGEEITDWKWGRLKDVQRNCSNHDSPILANASKPVVWEVHNKGLEDGCGSPVFCSHLFISDLVLQHDFFTTYPAPRQLSPSPTYITKGYFFIHSSIKNGRNFSASTAYRYAFAFPSTRVS